MTTKHYKTLNGLLKAIGTNYIDVHTFSRGYAYFRSTYQSHKFVLSDEANDEYWSGIAHVIWRKPSDAQISNLERVARRNYMGLFERLWYDGRRFVYCAGQDYPSEIRCIQNFINKN